MTKASICILILILFVGLAQTAEPSGIKYQTLFIMPDSLSHELPDGETFAAIIPVDSIVADTVFVTRWFGAFWRNLVVPGAIVQERAVEDEQATHEFIVDNGYREREE